MAQRLTFIVEIGSKIIGLRIQKANRFDILKNKYYYIYSLINDNLL